jgi:hypothetical protein
MAAPRGSAASGAGRFGRVAGGELTVATFEAAPDPVAQDAAAIREGVATAYAAATTAQGEAVRFLVNYGADVVGGHAPVGEPDPSLDAADSRGCRSR